MPLARFGTIADGIAVGRPGDLTFAHVSKLVDEVVTVTDEDISRGAADAAGAAQDGGRAGRRAAVAALLRRQVEVETPVVAILSGGNIDPMLLLRVIEHGLAAPAATCGFTVRCGDRPGQLARLLAQIAEQRANVVDVAHRGRIRACGSARWRSALSVETRGSGALRPARDRRCGPPATRVSLRRLRPRPALSRRTARTDRR